MYLFAPLSLAMLSDDKHSARFEFGGAMWPASAAAGAAHGGERHLAAGGEVRERCHGFRH